MGIFDSFKLKGLSKSLKDADPTIRAEAADALGMVGSPAVELLIRALEDGDWYVRERVVTALGMTGDMRVL